MLIVRDYSIKNILVIQFFYKAALPAGGRGEATGEQSCLPMETDSGGTESGGEGRVACERGGREWD